MRKKILGPFEEARLLYNKKKYMLAEPVLIRVLDSELSLTERNRAYDMLSHIYTVWAKPGSWHVGANQKLIAVCRDHIKWYEGVFLQLREEGPFAHKTDVFYRQSRIMEKAGRLGEALSVVQRAVALGIDATGKHARRAIRLQAKEAGSS